MAHGPIPDITVDEAAALEAGKRFLAAWAEKGFHSEVKIEGAIKHGDRITFTDSGQEFIAGQPRRDPDDGLVTTPLLPVPPAQ